MVEIHLYGRLRRFGPSSDPTIPCVLRAAPGADGRTVRDLVSALGIPDPEVASVFVDGCWQVAGLDAPLGGARRLGLFPVGMSLLYV